MKKNTLLLLSLVLLLINASAQTTIFKETFGTTQPSRGTCTTVAVPGTAEVGKYDPQKNEQYVDHVWSTDSHVWNDGISYSQVSALSTNPGACDDSGTTLNIRTNNSSSYTGASGDGNLYFNANILNSFTINGINTANYDNINLSFGIYGKNTADVTLLKLQYDSGSGLTDIGTSQIGALNTKKGTWLTISNVTLATSSNLSLTFSTPNTNSANANAPIEIRIDDIIISGTPTSTLANLPNADSCKLTVANSTITLDGFVSGTVEIYNTQGKRVFTSELKEIIQPQLAKGFYIVRIGDFRQKISF
ncbi:MAG: hypothetical protein Q8904_06270 [Bacteroidota bacterium]|nr:hypothetical protein [Bacteroidota bacterium]